MFRTEQICRLNCTIADALPDGVQPRLVVVMCHGYGASGSDLVPLGQMLLRQPKIAAGVQFLFPEAPLSLEEMGMPDGRAWWPIDMFKLQMAVALGRFREMRKDAPQEMPAAREKLTELIQHWSERVHVPIDRFILGGFSQGAMLTTDVTLHLDLNPAGVVLFSGTLVNEDVWAKEASKHKMLRVLQSHGTDDPILPFAGAVALRDMLNHAGADVEFLEFDGGHEIPQPVFERFGSFVLESVGDGRTSNSAGGH